MHYPMGMLSLSNCLSFLLLLSECLGYELYTSVTMKQSGEVTFRICFALFTHSTTWIASRL